jgi:uncharacterized glyoxalase superfamily protein PhnB
MSENDRGKVTASFFPAMGFKDAPRAVAWLAEAFGFERHAVYEDGGGGIAHAELRFGNGIVMLGSKRPPDPANPWTTEQGVYVAVDDIEAHYARAKAAGAEIVRPLADTEYGSREYSARDLEGHLWSFGTYRP